MNRGLDRVLKASDPEEARLEFEAVARELGHKSTGMIEDRYVPLADAPHRSETVEYRVENHKKKLKDQLKGFGRLPPRSPEPPF